MDGPVLNPTSRPSERPAPGDSRNSAPGSHAVGKGGADEVGPRWRGGGPRRGGAGGAELVSPGISRA